MGSNTNNATVVTQSNQRISALQKHVTTKTDIPIAGKKMKVSALVAIYQSVLDAGEAVTSTRGAFTLAVATRDEAEAQRKLADESLRSWVIINYGHDSQEAHDFGFVPKARATPSVETKAHAAALNRATRAARGTKGKKEKLKIKGTLPTPEVVATPSVAATAVPAVVSAPAAAPAGPVAPTHD